MSDASLFHYHFGKPLASRLFYFSLHLTLLFLPLSLFSFSNTATFILMALNLPSSHSLSCILRSQVWSCLLIQSISLVFPPAFWLNLAGWSPPYGFGALWITWWADNSYQNIKVFCCQLLIHLPSSSQWCSPKALYVSFRNYITSIHYHSFLHVWHYHIHDDWPSQRCLHNFTQYAMFSLY